jgi:hypothetical protein
VITTLERRSASSRNAILILCLGSVLGNGSGEVSWS